MTKAEVASRNVRRVVLGAFLAIAAFFLWMEHRAHVLGLAPYLLVLACPLLHWLMHGRRQHGGERGGHHHETTEAGS